MHVRKSTFGAGLLSAALALGAFAAPATAELGPDDALRYNSFGNPTDWGPIGDSPGCPTPGPVKVADINVNGFPSGKEISDVTVFFGSNHTHVGNLRVELRAPDGTTAVLFDRPPPPVTAFGVVFGDGTWTCANGGDSSDLNPAASYVFRDGGVDFSNAARGSLGSPPNNGPVPSGTYAAEGGSLAEIFQNAQPNGTWELRVQDYDNGETGDLTYTFLQLWSDDTAPTTEITSGPEDGVAPGPVTFEFEGEDANGLQGFDCSLDGGPWTTCSSPYTANVEQGDHRLEVRAVDDSGNRDATPAFWTFIAGEPPADEAPDTQITGGPADGATVDADPTFEFTSADEDVDHFECQVDGGEWVLCTSPHGVVTDGPGEHTFSVRAVDEGGNVDETPATRTFTVAEAPDTDAPDTTITDGPTSGAIVTSAPTYSFTSPNDDATGFKCSLDGGPATDCTSPHTVTVTEPGIHEFSVAAVDAAGNVDATPATATFTYDPEPPVSQECLDAQAKLSAKKAKLAELRANDAPRKKIRKVRGKVRQLRILVREVC